MNKMFMLLVLTALALGCTKKESKENEEIVPGDTVKIVVTEVPVAEIDSLDVEVIPVEEETVEL